MEKKKERKTAPIGWGGTTSVNGIQGLGESLQERKNGMQSLMLRNGANGLGESLRGDPDDTK